MVVMENIYKPILFSTPMVHGILDEIKNQTRRTKGLEVVNEDIANILELKLITDPDKIWVLVKTKSNGTYKVKCPYNLGEILWVRETFAPGFNQFIYKADERFGKYECQKWKPSIFMPKKACRIFLKVIAIRIERLNEITVFGAEDEGVEKRLIDGDEEFKNYLAAGITDDEPWGDSYFANNPVLSFMSLWRSINGVESWDLNPWVWVIKFEIIDKPLSFI